MNPSDIDFRVATLSEKDGYHGEAFRRRTTYVFVFVPVNIEKKSDLMVPLASYGPFVKLRRLFVSHDRRLLPFWTWFIDNPRSKSPKINPALDERR